MPMRFLRGQVQVLLHAAQAVFKLADQHAMASDGSVIVEDGAAQACHLVAGDLVLDGVFCLHQYKVGRNIGAQQIDLALEFGLDCGKFGANASDLCANIAQQFNDEIFRFVAQGGVTYQEMQ